MVSIILCGCTCKVTSLFFFCKNRFFCVVAQATSPVFLLNNVGERGGSVVECRTPEREVRGSRPTAAVLCPWARHFTPRKYWLITQEAMAPSRYDWKIVDWDVKPQHNQLTTEQCQGKSYTLRALVVKWAGIPRYLCSLIRTCAVWSSEALPFLTRFRRKIYIPPAMLIRFFKICNNRFFMHVQNVHTCLPGTSYDKSYALYAFHHMKRVSK